jgi:hypothetical protein
MDEFPQSWCNTERRIWDQRFYTCKIDIHDPFRRAIRKVWGYVDCSSWIYVESSSWNECLRDHCQVAGKIPPQGAPYVPAFVKLLLHVTKTLDITLHHQPTNKEVEAQLESAWPQFIDAAALSDNLRGELINIMANLVPEPKTSGFAAGESTSAQTRVQNTNLKIIYGMAKGRYKYNPDVKWHESTETIVNDVKKAGFRVSADTVLSRLKAAHDLREGADSEEKNPN